MKKLLILTMMICVGMNLYAGSIYQKLTLIKYTFIADDGYGEEEAWGHRSPEMQYECIIGNEYGLRFQTPTPPGIESYEIWTTTSNCIYVDKNEESFIDFLFTLSGTYEIHLITYDSILIGKISL